jgi:hypothetical protein
MSNEQAEQIFNLARCAIIEAAGMEVTLCPEEAAKKPLFE